MIIDYKPEVLIPYLRVILTFQHYKVLLITIDYINYKL